VTQKLFLAACAALIVGSWAILALVYAEHGGGGYNGEELVGSVLAAVSLTLLAGFRVARGLIRGSGTASASLTTVGAVLCVWLLVFVVNGRG
jgi:hypothetical protein